jgi:hypothetical protein
MRAAAPILKESILFVRVAADIANGLLGDAITLEV